jgi:hypothetical protein
MEVVQNTGLKRDTKDKYYTRNCIVDQCIHIIKNTLDIDFNDDLIIEPGAGNGAFMEPITQLCSNHVFYDIAPENENIIQQDFLETSITEQLYKNIHVIGNPPFGRQSCLALRFIRHASTFANTISFILPKSFKKQSMIDKIPKYFHLMFQVDLPKNSFEVEKTIYDVPCVFQIWVKCVIPRLPEEKVKPIGYEFVKKAEPHHISFRRVGVNAGDIAFFPDTQTKSPQSHYFIRFSSDATLSSIPTHMKFEHDNTVGPKSISKQECIKEMNKISDT